MKLKFKLKRKEALELWKYPKSLKQRMRDITDYFITETDKLREQMMEVNYYKGFVRVSIIEEEIITNLEENTKNK